MDTKQLYRKCVLDIEAEALLPTEGRIICIGLMEIDNGITHIFFDRSERIMVQRFIRYFNYGNFGEIIGYNILYDIRYIFGKCLKYNISVGRFYSAHYNDLMMILKSVKNIYCFNKPGTLNQWSSYLFGEGKKLVNSSVPSLYKQGRINEIIQYNKKDLQLTYKLWERINQIIGSKRQKQGKNYGKYDYVRNIENNPYMSIINTKHHKT